MRSKLIRLKITIFFSVLLGVCKLEAMEKHDMPDDNPIRWAQSIVEQLDTIKGISWKDHSPESKKSIVNLLQDTHSKIKLQLESIPILTSSAPLPSPQVNVPLSSPQLVPTEKVQSRPVFCKDIPPLTDSMTYDDNFYEKGLVRVTSLRDSCPFFVCEHILSEDLKALSAQKAGKLVHSTIKSNVDAIKKLGIYLEDNLHTHAHIWLLTYNTKKPAGEQNTLRRYTDCIVNPVDVLYGSLSQLNEATHHRFKLRPKS